MTPRTNRRTALLFALLVGTGAALVLLAVWLVGAFDSDDDSTTVPPSGDDQSSTTTDDRTPPVDENLPAARTLSGEESFPDGLTVPAGEVWELDPTTTTTVTSEANVVVEGVLRMRPSDHEVVHTLRFENVDESLVVGAEAEDHDAHDSPVVETDVGLWVIGDGQLDVEGSERAAWNRTGTDPTWQPDDEVRVAPTEPGDSTTFAEFEPGDEVPSVSYAEETYAAEVLNLTRNVRIQGTGDGEADPDGNGRAHIWINSTRPQTIRFAELAHLGPRHPGDDDPTEGVVGRYPLHFHHAGDGSRGSLVEGVVVRDSGNRAFVPHGSHGITIRDTVAYNVFDSAYWWDPDDSGHGGPAANLTNDLSIEHALAAQVRGDPDHRAFLISGFVLGEGENVAVTDSVAVGVQGSNTASGFHWPATANGNEHNVWGFSGNVAHNNAVNGIFVWQNDGNDHLVEDFVGYHNGAFGVDHGAYGNNYTYDGLVLFGNGEAGIRSKAAATDRPQTWRNVDTDSILIADRALDASTPTVFEDVTLRGPVLVDEAGDTPSGEAVYEFRDVRTAQGGELSVDDFDVIHQVSEITVHLDDGDTFELD